MLKNAYFLAKIGADTAENEQHFVGGHAARSAADAARRPGRSAIVSSGGAERNSGARTSGHHASKPVTLACKKELAISVFFASVKKRKIEAEEKGKSCSSTIMARSQVQSCAASR